MKFLITAGPTRESIDPVRFLTNRSSGKMGYAIANAAIEQGHKVVLISGIVSLPPLENARMLFIESAEDMYQAVSAEYKSADIVIMSAAVADFTPVKYYSHKFKKSGHDNLILELKKTVDILGFLGQNKKDGQLLVGFAAESENIIANAREKLKRKNLDWIIANNISTTGLGFQSDNNAITMISRKGQTLEYRPQAKMDLGRKIIQVLLKDED